jgi:hypothetical protein
MANEDKNSKIVKLEKQLELQQKLIVTLLDGLRFAIELDGHYSAKLEEATSLLRVLSGSSQGSIWK